MIKFLKDREVRDHAGELERAFKAGDKVEDLSPESETGHVRRGFAAFVGEDGTLTDHEGRVVTEAKPAPVMKPAGSKRGLERRALPRGKSPAKPKKAAAKKPAAKKAAAKAGGSK